MYTRETNYWTEFETCYFLIWMQVELMDSGIELLGYIDENT